MKKILFALFILILLFAIGLTIFFSTFDINKYKSLITSKAEEATGNGITIGDLDLSFTNGLGLNFTNLKIYPDREKTNNPSLMVRNGTMLLSLAPLLKREILVNKLIFKNPVIKIFLADKGVTSVGGIKIDQPAKAKQEPYEQAKTTPKKTSTKKKEPLSFFVSLIDISDGTVMIMDDNASILSSPVTITDIDVTLRDISFSSPILFDVKMGVFSHTQNIIANGKCHISSEGQIKLENSVLKIDLDQLNMPEVLKTFPEIRSSGLSDNVSGKLDLNARSMALDPNKLNEADATLDLSNAGFKFNNLPSAFSDINMRAELKNNTLNITSASLNFAEGAVKANGTVTDITGEMMSSVDANLKGLSITSLAPPPSTGDAYVSGNVSGHIKSTFKGFNWPAMADTISATGNLSLENFVLKNKNIVREVFKQISSIPGLVSNLESRLSDEYKKTLNKKDTEFHPINLDMNINNGTLHCNDIDIRTDDFAITGKIEVGIASQGLGGKTALLIGPELSLAFVKIVNELVHIENSNKEIEIPIKLKGSITNVEVIPDLNYLAKKIITTEIQNNVRDFLKDALSKEKEPDPADATANSDSPGTTQTQEKTTTETNNTSSSIAELFIRALQE